MREITEHEALDRLDDMAEGFLKALAPELGEDPQRWMGAALMAHSATAMFQHAIATAGLDLHEVMHRLIDSSNILTVVTLRMERFVGLTADIEEP